MRCDGQLFGLALTREGALDSGRPGIIPFALTAYALPHVIGMLPTRAGTFHPRPLGAIDLMDAAAELGLAGVELALPSGTAQRADALRDALRSRKLRIITDFMVLIDADADAF